MPWSARNLAIMVALASTLFFVACGTASARSAPADVPAPAIDLPAGDGDTSRQLVLAGGCFWCVEAVFEPLRGVTNVVSGYAGGSAADANYDLVSAGRTRHAEAVKITYDPRAISYGTLLRVFFATHQPTNGKGQHPDYGSQYRPAIFYATPEERAVSAAYIEQLTKARVFDDAIATGLEPLEKFYDAEAYHQDFVARNADHPYVKRWALPKVAKVRKVFPSLLAAPPASSRPGARDGAEESLEPVVKTDREWEAELSAAQFKILRREGTERPFTSPLNKEKRRGVFRCAGCDLSVFASQTKFDSGTGWPSFYEPVDPRHIAEKSDRGHGMIRTEIECARCGGHLGHVFNDGPAPTGLRYCINGDALTFEPK